MQGQPVLRVVRPTDDLVPVRRFYVDALQFPVIYGFEGHDGFDGLIVGVPGAAYHFAFTRKHGYTAGRAATPENLLVFYLEDEAAWHAAVARMQAHGFDPVEPHNPYWRDRGATFEDPDGYRVVLHKGGA